VDVPSTSGLWVWLVVIALVVGRFLLRELRDRRIPFQRFFALPLVFVALAVWLVLYAVWTAPTVLVEVAAGTLAAIAVGAGLGLAVDRFTSVRLGPGGTSAIVRGSWATAAIWIVALALRVVGRFVAFGAGLRSAQSTLALNAVLVVLLAAALIALRVRLFARAKALVSVATPNSG
jgi:hypothetical protein